MKQELYNSKDENFEHVKNLLKELPKIKAPDNFEYNLKVKIQNKSFSLNSEEKVGFNPWKIFVPIAGTAAASILAVLFIFNNNSSEMMENPFQIIPKLRTEISSNLMNSEIYLQKFGENKKITERDVIVKQNDNLPEEEKVVVNKQALIAGNQETGNLKEIKKEFPFENYNSTDIDKVLNAKRSGNNINRRVKLAGRSTSQNYFNGFFLGEEVDKEYVEALKARLDSVKKALLNREQHSKMAQ